MISFSSFGLTVQDDIDLLHLRVPVPTKEPERMTVLRQAKILDTNPHEADFDRYTVLCARIFKV